MEGAVLFPRTSEHIRNRPANASINRQEKENLYKIEHTHPTVYVKTVSCDEDVSVEEATLDTYSYKLHFARSGNSCDINEIIDLDRPSRERHETPRSTQEAAFLIPSSKPPCCCHSQKDPD